MSQADRILKALRQVGPRGITRHDFDGPVVIDDGPRIFNMPGRIYDLRGKGHKIDDAGERDGCTVYVLDVAREGTPRPSRSAPGRSDLPARRQGASVAAPEGPTPGEASTPPSPDPGPQLFEDDPEADAPRSNMYDPYREAA